MHGGHFYGEGLQTHGGHSYGGHQHLYPGNEKAAQALPLSCPPYAVDPLGALATSDPGRINPAAAFLSKHLYKCI